jgi:hypothetical protein
MASSRRVRPGRRAHGRAARGRGCGIGRARSTRRGPGPRREIAGGRVPENPLARRRFPPRNGAPRSRCGRACRSRSGLPRSAGASPPRSAGRGGRRRARRCPPIPRGAGRSRRRRRSGSVSGLMPQRKKRPSGRQKVPEGVMVSGMGPGGGSAASKTKRVRLRGSTGRSWRPAVARSALARGPEVLTRVPQAMVSPVVRRTPVMRSPSRR